MDRTLQTLWGLASVMALHDVVLAHLGLAVSPGGQIRRTVRPDGGAHPHRRSRQVVTQVFLHLPQGCRYRRGEPGEGRKGP